jgi:hypothetical protein
MITQTIDAIKRLGNITEGVLMKHGMIRRGWGLLLAVLVLTTLSCATEVGDIDRTKPDKLRKADFMGVWYYATTVTEAPVPSPLTFDGEMAYFPGPTKIIFDIQEDYLVVYPTAELYVDGAEKGWHSKKIRNYWEEGKASEFIEMYVGQPVGAFEIKKHFDVIRKYNPQTGDQSNVIVENDSDKKWFEREYMRVDWSKNVIKDLMFIAGTTSSSVDYYVQEYEEDNPDAYEQTEDSINFVTKLYVEPSSPDSCSIYMVAPSDCAGVVVKLRHSFMKVDPNNDYVPLFYDQGTWMSEFGYFLTERHGYDENYGLNYFAKITLIQRWNLWTNSRTAGDILDENGAQYTCMEDAECEGLHDGQTHCWLDDGWFTQGRCVTWDPTPIHERGLKPVRYWISPDWPDEMKISCYETAENWNKPFRDTVAWAKLWSEKGLLATKYCETHADCTPDDALLDKFFDDQRPRYCNPATEAEDKVCQFGFTGVAGKEFHKCSSSQECVRPLVCSANNPCNYGQMCFNDFCHECAVEGGECNPEAPAEWSKIEETITNRGAFALYYLPDPGSGAGKTTFLRGVDDDFEFMGSGEVRVNFAHLNPFVGDVKLVANNVSVCTNEDGSDVVFSYVGADLFRTPGCTIELPKDDNNLPTGTTLNFTLIDVTTKKAVGVYNFVHLTGQTIHTLALVGDDKKASLIYNMAPQSELEYRGMRFVHAVSGDGAYDFSVGGALTKRNVSFGESTPYGHLAKDGSRVVVLPSGSGGNITCFQQDGVGQCTGWAPELTAADMTRLAEIQGSIPDMFLACDNIYTGNLCTDEERGDASLLNDCRYWYQDEAQEWHNPCGEVEGAENLKKHGDIRYSSMYWISEDQSSSPLGYGPNASDPDTGEVYFGIANIYGAPMIGYGNYGKDLLDLSVGKLDKLDVMTGKYIRDYLDNKNAEAERTGSLYAPLPDNKRLQRIKQVAKPLEKFWFTPEEEDNLRELLSNESLVRKILDPKEAKAHLAKSMGPTMGPEQLSERFGRVKGTSIEDLLINEEVKLLADGSLGGADALSPEQMAAISPMQWMSNAAIEKDQARLNKLAEHNYYAAEMHEPNVYATAKRVEAWCADKENLKAYGWDKYDWSDDECQVWYMTKMMLDGVLEHEVGHTVGLRHNFSASKDIFNYQDEYYKIREEEYRVCRMETQWGCPHGDTCHVRCEKDADCMPGTTCMERDVDLEGGLETVQVCVDEHLEVKGWCWGNRDHVTDCQGDGDCAAVAADSRCRIRPNESWGVCQVKAAPDGGVCPTGTIPVSGACLTEDSCLTSVKRCALDGAKACTEDGDCNVVWVDSRETVFEPIKAFAPRIKQTQAEIEAGRSEFMYSSIMDYGGTVNFDLQGIGKYDQAAIRFGYGELVDVYMDTDRIRAEMEEVPDVWGGSKYGWLSGIFMDTSIYNDFYWFSPFYFLTDFVGLKENQDRMFVPYRQALGEYRMLNSDDRGLWDASYFRVSYEMRTDQWRGSLETYVWDLGADLGEILDHSWNKLQEYYIFDAFKRERWAAYRGANPLGYYNRIKGRWFPPFEDAGRYHALFWQGWRGYEDSLRPFMFASDHFMGRWKMYSEFAMRRISDVMFSPAPGSYKLVDEGLPTERFVNISFDAAQAGSELDVPVGPGKFPYTTFYDQAGYYYFDHAAFIGSFWEKLAASSTLTYAMGYFIGDYLGEQVDVGVGSSVGFNSIYYTEITNMVAGFLTDRREHFAPYVEEGKMHFYDPFHPEEGAGMPRLETGVESVSMKAYHGLFGFAFIPSGFDNGFIETMRICLKGNGSCFAVDDPDSDNPYAIETMEYTDPWTKKTYLARTTNFASDRIDASYDLLSRANDLKAEWEAIDADASDEAYLAKEALGKRLSDTRETLDLLLSFSELYGAMDY